MAANQGIAETWGGFLFVVLATAVAVIVGVPLVNKATQKLFSKSAADLLTFRKAA
jgi:hypothetical protein